MPSDVFWTGLFTVSGGIVGAGVGYATARLQHSLQREQLGLEERRHHGQEAQAGRERHESHREQRRQIYLQYLETLDAIINLGTSSSADLDLLNSRWIDFMRTDNELELAGTDEIRRVSYPLHSVANRVIDEYRAIICDPARNWSEAANEFMHDEMRDARGEMVSFMRSDLQAETDPVPPPSYDR